LLRKKGINAFVFGVTDKSDLLLIPIVAFFFYALLSTVNGYPFPGVLVKPFFSSSAAGWSGIIVCYGSLVWFALTLVFFGRSFRIGIDEKKPDNLVTSGTFGLSRNPIYVGFLSFAAGMFLIHPNLAASAAIVFFVIVIHRQILREEKFLRQNYGGKYDNYCSRVRRYL
jgi:protein-S-isoprenylcysteine O-methyltransferase Ste14